ncbi:hypothetical protein M5689_023235 [Euphorbia peplus]|nr:hypothetical protein M5689_023235 [Euphorbia peplus]
MLREAFKIITKNAKIFAFISFITLSINSIQYFSNFYSVKPIILDLIMEAYDSLFPEENPESANMVSHMTTDLSFFDGLGLIYFTIETFSFLLTTTATILAAALVYDGKQNDLSFKNLLSRTVKSLHRVLTTWFFIVLFGLIFLFIPLFLIFLTVLTFTDHSQLLLASVLVGLLILTMILYLYLDIKWYLALVISAVEQTKGMEAIRKAGAILKGMRLKGFLINLLLSVIAMVLSFGMSMISPGKTPPVLLFKGVVVPYINSLLNMYRFAVFTVMYCMWKKS